MWLTDLAAKAKNVGDALATHLLWKPGWKGSLPLMLEQWAQRHPHHRFLQFEGRHWTVGDFNAEVNRHAHAWRELGLGAGDVVAVIMDNRPELLLHIFGLGKLGVVASLVNPNLVGAPLAHAITACEPRALVCSDVFQDHLAAVAGDIDLAAHRVQIDSEAGRLAELPLAGWQQWIDHLERQPTADPPQTAERRLGDVFAYIYTSGTTGMPKPAVVKHHKAVRVARNVAAITFATPSDCFYVCLPLYHANGLLMGVGAAIAAGARLAIARRFSASRFWQDCTEHQATLFDYIGETCRYLYQSPPGPYDRAHQVRTIVGNGLRPDIWDAFVERFDIGRVVEIYGSTEGNAETANVFGTTGSCGILLPGRNALVRYDLERGEFVRNARGRMQKVKAGEPGVLIGKIKPGNAFDGYATPGATATKVLEDVFRKGDRWFDTGDLLRRDRLGRLYFVDRLGDTFRWRGENVATGEVAEALDAAPSIREAAVYGVLVPGQEGRAGMAAVVAAGAFDPAGVFAYVDANLPPYAQPRFIRVVDGLEVTQTFKHRKADLQDEGFDPASVSDPLFVRDAAARTYRELTSELHEQVVGGRFPL